MKKYLLKLGGDTIQKSCIPGRACTEKSTSILGYGYSVNCCNTSNCNSSSLLKFKPIFITVALSLVLYLAKIK
jgi:hypothetical protein